jgi:hypothetical protein
MIGTEERPRGWPVAGLTAAAVVAAAILALDMATPRGVADGTLYVALVLASAGLPWPKAPLGTAVIGTATVGKSGLAKIPRRSASWPKPNPRSGSEARVLQAFP